MLKHALSILAVAVITVATAVVAPSPAEAKVNVYTTPGRHVVDGRQWNTTCAPYDEKITRCRAEIKSGGKWAFNNLSYLATDRIDWYDNPLARPGKFSSSGRDWITSCNDDWTAKNACRSFIRSGNKWVFNNLVYFTPGTVDYPKFTFNEKTGKLTAKATPSTGYWTLREVSLHSATTGSATKGGLVEGAATIVTQREVSGRSEVFHDGVFGWILTDALTQDVGRPSVSPTRSPVTPMVPPKPPGVSTAGSLPVGSAKYPVPANAIFVTAGDARSGSGTSSNPYRSLAYALESVESGSTVVMRGGIYHESTRVPFYKKLTIQAYPNEAVWLDGSSVVEGWRRSGDAWVVGDWDHIFDHRVSDSEGVDQSNRFIDPGFPDGWLSRPGVGVRCQASAGQFSGGGCSGDLLCR